MPTEITEQPPVKRGRGRPPNTDKNGVSSNERLLPAPPRFSIQDFSQFVKYWLELTPEHRTRVTVHVYRHWPVIDRKKIDEKANTSIEVFPGENPPFDAPKDWEDTLLRLYGSGDYMFWLNEMGKTVCKGFARPRRDLDNYPPLVELSELVDEDPANKAYVDYLRKRGLFTPAMANAKQTEEEMATNEALKEAIQSANEMAHLAVSTSQRQNIPVPPPPNNDRIIETLVKPMMTMMEKSTEQAVAMVQKQNSGSDPLAVVETVMKMQAQTTAAANASNKPMELMFESLTHRLEAAESRNSALMERLLGNAATAEKPKSLLEQLKELKELEGLLKGDDDEENPRRKSSGAGGIVPMLIEALPTITTLGLGVFDRFNTMLQYTAMIKAGQNPAQLQQAPPPQQAAATPPPAPATPANGAPGATTAPPGNEPSMNPETGLPYTDVEIEDLRQLTAKYAPYHGLIETMRPQIIATLASSDQDGVDLAEWFITQHGRFTYDQIKVAADAGQLYDAMRCYTPLWQQVGRHHEEMREMCNDFFGYDDAMKEEEGKDAEVLQ